MRCDPQVLPGKPAMSTRTKIAILGGSALATPLIFQEFARQGATGAYDFVLFGRNPERLGLVERVSKAAAAQTPNLDVRISSTSNAEAALEGVDFCVNQIRSGGLDGRAFDETFPR